MELASDKVRMIRQLHNLHVGAVGSRAGNLQSRRRQHLFIFTIEFVTVAMALADFELAINFVGEGAGLKPAGPGSETHGATEFLNSAQFAQLVDHSLRRSRIKFA